MACSRMTGAAVSALFLLALTSVYAVEVTELAYDKGIPASGAYLGNPYGHMVLFFTPSSTWLIQKVRIFGFQFGNQTEKLEFNININQFDFGGLINSLYSKTFPYSEFKSRSTWVDIDVGGVITNRTLFAVLVFTSSTSERGIRVGFTNSSTNEYVPGSPLKARHSVIVNGRLASRPMLESWDEIKFQRNPPLEQNKTNWMIRAVGVSLSPAAATSTTVKTSFPFGSLDITLQQIAGVAATGGSVVLGWSFKTRKRRLVSGYLKRIESTYAEYRANPDECRERLDQMKNEIDDMLDKGKIDEAQLTIMDARIARHLRDIA